jgi:hypothetical protein
MHNTIIDAETYKLVQVQGQIAQAPRRMGNCSILYNLSFSSRKAEKAAKSSAEHGIDGLFNACFNWLPWRRRRCYLGWVLRQTGSIMVKLIFKIR